MSQRTLDSSGARILYDQASAQEAGQGVEIFVPMAKLIDSTPGSLRPIGTAANPLHTQTGNKQAFLDLIGVSRKRGKLFGKGFCK